MGLFGIAETIGELEKALNATGRNLDQVRDLPFTTLKAARPEEGSVYVYLTPDAVEPDPDDLVNKVRAALALGALAIVTDQPVGDIDGVAVPQIVVSDAQAAIDDVITRCVAAKNAVIVGVMGTDEVQMTADMIATSTGAAEGSSSMQTASLLDAVATLPEYGVFALRLPLAPSESIESANRFGIDALVVTGFDTDALGAFESFDYAVDELNGVLSTLKAESLLVVNADFPTLANIEAPCKVVRIGSDVPNVDIALSHASQTLERLSCEAVVRDEEGASKTLELQAPIVGLNRCFSMGAAFALLRWLSMDDATAVTAIARYRALAPSQTFYNVGGYRLYLACYGTSELGIENVLATMKSLDCAGRKIVVIAARTLDEELRADAFDRIVKCVLDSGVDQVVCYGSVVRDLCVGLWKAGLSNTLYLENMNMLASYLQLADGDDVIALAGDRRDALLHGVDLAYGTDLFAGNAYYRRRYAKRRIKDGIVYRIFSCNTASAATIDGRRNEDRTVYIPGMVSKFSVTHINDEAFAHQGLISVDVGRNVRGIGDGAFAGCAVLRSAIFGEKLRRIGERAFEGCVTLRDAVLPETLVEIADYAFAGCAGLRVARVPEGVRCIGEHAFEGCDSLVIECAPGSFAEQYAKRKGIDTVEIVANEEDGEQERA